MSRRAKPLPLSPPIGWEFDAPAQVLVTFCPQCGNVGVAVRVHQKPLVTDRRCEFCPGGRAPILRVVHYERRAPPVVKRRPRRGRPPRRRS
jgi:hypothetical protein